MNYQSILLVLISLTAFITLSLEVYAWRHRRSHGAEALSLLMLAATAYVFPYALQLISADVYTMLFWYYLTLPAITAIPPLWFWFTLQVTGRRRLLTQRTKI
ncbi:MAG: hypothetical protein MUO76_10350, partial [Anaerolineaceae bacterium]|nr:hypothetical protein [Anaerolineaceae bacterium]